MNEERDKNIGVNTGNRRNEKEELEALGFNLNEAGFDLGNNNNNFQSPFNDQKLETFNFEFERETEND